MSDESALVVQTRPKSELAMSEADEVARNAICKRIVESTSIEISGRRYIRVEGWRAIAAAYGCTLCSRDVERVEHDSPDHCGYRAIGEVVASDGRVIGVGEGFVGDDEPLWKKRKVFARRAMAQTRAQSRAAKVFDFVLVLMDGNYETTPAEEMESAVAAIPPVQTPSDRPSSIIDRGRVVIRTAETETRLNELRSRIDARYKSGELTQRELDELIAECKTRALQLDAARHGVPVGGSNDEPTDI